MSDDVRKLDYCKKNKLADKFVREGSELVIMDLISRGEMRARWVFLSDYRISSALCLTLDPQKDNDNFFF